MNIGEAKQQILNTMKVYFAKDEFGSYQLAPEEQRPVFLMGPPGIGKTAIMKQVAEELGVGLITYSMTHHTRQSALGLPAIVKKTYAGEEVTVSEYTMSEIVASVYDMMEETDTREGILFLDEINCVSETLTPVMLQFLQFKTFGRHKVPDGWIIVTAGNPLEYNRSAREFDIVTMDRIKWIEVEADYPAWKRYALRKGVHASISTYLDVKKENFYRIESTVSGIEFITARGWMDLSNMLHLYEQNGIVADLSLISQYIRMKEVAEDFAIYYDLFHKYHSDYKIEAILKGEEGTEIQNRAREASFDERLSLLGILQDSVTRDIRSVIQTEDVVTGLLKLLKEVKTGSTVQTQYALAQQQMHQEMRRGTLTTEGRKRYERILAFLEKHEKKDSDFPEIKGDYDQMVAAMKENAASVQKKLDHLFQFVENVWTDGQELLILVTEMTSSFYCARFIARYGCERYYRHNDELLFYERQTEILKELEGIKELF